MELPPPPTNLLDIAKYIWVQQDLLNGVCHPEGKGTIDREKNRTPRDRQLLEFDYYLALKDESSELVNNFIWKHWSKETREGKRFHLINPDGASGEGTAQNVAVELIDIVFFTVSLLHIRNAEEVWLKIFGSEKTWEPRYDHNGRGHPSSNRSILEALWRFEKSILHDDNGQAIHALIDMFYFAGLSWRELADLYYNKLKINYARQARGRLQVGDALAHDENSSISV